MYIYIYVYIYVYIYMYIYICICIYIYMHMYKDDTHYEGPCNVGFQNLEAFLGGPCSKEAERGQPYIFVNAQLRCTRILEGSCFGTYKSFTIEICRNPGSRNTVLL